MNKTMLLISFLIFIIFSDTASAQNVYFSSDWSYATGTSCNAIRDGTSWDAAMSTGCNPEPASTRLEVFQGCGPLGHNCLGVWANHVGGHGWNYLEKYNLGYNEDDDTYFRFYIKVYPAVGFDYAYAHYIEDQHNANNGYFGIFNVDANHWQAYIWSLAHTYSGLYDWPYREFWTNMDLNVNEWYRIEGHIDWIDHLGGSNGGRTIYEIRIYDSNGVLVKDTDDWYTQDYPTNPPYQGYTLREWYNRGEYFRMDGTREGWKFGDNGPASGTGAGRVCDIAAFAMADNQWIGPVAPVGGQLQSCSLLGGSCCSTGQSCAGGSFTSSTDCGSLCCVGGSCQNPAVCGNSIVETGEQCDDGNTVTENCTYGQTSCIVCSASCQNVSGVTSYCGDGFCDPSNENAASCSQDCSVPSVCTDADSDGYGVGSDRSVCTHPELDCNDNSAAIHPGATEICNDNQDNDCDGQTDCADPDCSTSPSCSSGVINVEFGDNQGSDHGNPRSRRVRHHNAARCHPHHNQRGLVLLLQEKEVNSG